MSHHPPAPTPPSAYRVCFVCTGNICRSPMAEWVLKSRLTGTDLAGLVVVDSAGTGGWHVGEGADPRAVRVLAEHGYPSRHRAKKFEPGDLLRRDLVIALDSEHLRTLRQWGDDRRGRIARLHLLREFDPAADPAAPGGLDIPDPYYGSHTGFQACLAMVEAAMPGLIGHIEDWLEAAQVPEK